MRNACNYLLWKAFFCIDGIFLLKDTIFNLACYCVDLVQLNLEDKYHTQAAKSFYTETWNED